MNQQKINKQILDLDIKEHLKKVIKEVITKK